MQPSPYSDTPSKDALVLQLNSAHEELQQLKAACLRYVPPDEYAGLHQRKIDINKKIQNIQYQLSLHNDKTRRLVACVGRLLAAGPDEVYDAAYDDLETAYKELKQ